MFAVIHGAQRSRMSYFHTLHDVQFLIQQKKITDMYKRCGSARLGVFVTKGFSKFNQNKEKHSQNSKQGFNLLF